MGSPSAAAVLVCLLICAVATAQVPPASPKPGSQQKKFEAFVGTWSYEGMTKTASGPGGKITGTDAYRMLPGGFFLEHHWDEKSPTGPIQGTEIWAYDPVKKAYTYNYYSNSGEFGSGTITINGNTWTFLGTGITFDRKNSYTRWISTFTSPTSFTVKAEFSSDGKTFTPGFEAKFTKTK